MAESAVVSSERVDAAGLSKPRLLFFYSAQSGQCRRVEGFLSQVLQRRKNHATFQILRVSKDASPELAERLLVEQVPTLLVVEGKRVRARLARPRDCREIENLLAPWLK